MATPLRRTFGNKEAPKKGDASRGRKILMDKLEKSRQANAFARGEGPKTSGGTKAPKGSVAKPQGGRGAGGTRPPGGGNIRPAQKGGLPSVRATRTEVKTFNKPGGAVTEYKKPGGSVTKYQKPSTAVTEYKKPGMSPAKIEKPSAGGGAVAKGGSYLAEGLKLAGRAGGVYVDMIANAKPLNAGEKEWIADKKNRGPLMPGNKKYDKPIGPERPARTYGEKIGPEAPRGAAGTYTKSYDVKPKAAEPPKASASSAAAPKKAGDKSSQAGKAKPTSATGTPAKKMTAFERQKARMYEKEGYGGRSMTAAQAKARVEKERGQKMEMPRFLKSSSKEAPKKASGTARPQYKSQKARDFAAKMQGRNPSGKAEKSFRFKDLFK